LTHKLAAKIIHISPAAVAVNFEFWQGNLQMAVFNYEALTPQGAIEKGTLAADSSRQARDILRDRGLTLKQVVPGLAVRSTMLGLFRRKKRSAARLSSMVQDLSTLLTAGILLTEALDTLIRQHRGRFKTALMLVRDRVMAGASLAQAFGEQEDVFDELSVRMVEVGENSGTLDVVLEQLAEFKDRSLQLKDRVLTALLYPFIVLVVSLGVCLFLMVGVIPMLLANLIEAGRPLPWPTRVLKGASDALLHHGFSVAVGIAVLCVAAVILVRTPRGRRIWHRALLRVPVLGSMALKQSISRIAFIMSTLIRSGIEYLSALEIAARSTRNVILREALEQSGTDVRDGRDIGPALERANVFPPVVVQIFTVGQQSGRLEEMLDRLAAKYDRQVASASARLAAALEPVLIVTLAVFVGFILFATMLPILEAGHVL
jgi:type II secretory pathway component PulF